MVINIAVVKDQHPSNYCQLIGIVWHKSWCLTIWPKNTTHVLNINNSWFSSTGLKPINFLVILQILSAGQEDPPSCEACRCHGRHCLLHSGERRSQCVYSENITRPFKMMDDKPNFRQVIIRWEWYWMCQGGHVKGFYGLFMFFYEKRRPGWSYWSSSETNDEWFWVTNTVKS